MWIIFLAGLTCLVSCIIALVFVQSSGSYWLALFDGFAASIPMLVVGLCELLVVVYVYGIDRYKGNPSDIFHSFVFDMVNMIFHNRFNMDMEFMVGQKPNFFWQATWRVISPLILLVILVFYFIKTVSKKLTYIVWDPDSVITLTENVLKMLTVAFLKCSENVIQ